MFLLVSQRLYLKYIKLIASMVGFLQLIESTEANNIDDDME